MKFQHETEFTQQIASDCIWSDPASNEQVTRLPILNTICLLFFSATGVNRKHIAFPVSLLFSFSQEKKLDANGFGPSLRGGDCVCFGTPVMLLHLRVTNVLNI